MFDLKNKVAFITGGATGIGALVVECLLEEDVKQVITLDVDEVKGITLQNELNKKFGDNKVKFIKGDVTNDADLAKAYEQGYIDVVINNAGILNDSRDKYIKEIEINVSALITNTFKAIDVMSRENGGKGGAVMNISSAAALTQSEMFPVYSATKSAVLQFSNCIGASENYAKTGVRVLTICFGFTNTSLLSKEKLGRFGKDIDEEIMTGLNAYQCQEPKSAARSVVDAIKQGESGTTWLSNNDEPAKDITSSVKKAYEILSEHVVYLFKDQ